MGPVLWVSVLTRYVKDKRRRRVHAVMVSEDSSAKSSGSGYNFTCCFSISNRFSIILKISSTNVMKVEKKFSSTVATNESFNIFERRLSFLNNSYDCRS